MGDAHMGPVAAAIPQMDWYERGLDGKTSLRIILGRRGVVVVYAGCAYAAKLVIVRGEKTKF